MGEMNELETGTYPPKKESIGEISSTPEVIKKAIRIIWIATIAAITAKNCPREISSGCCETGFSGFSKGPSCGLKSSLAVRLAAAGAFLLLVATVEAAGVAGFGGAASVLTAPVATVFAAFAAFAGFAALAGFAGFAAFAGFAGFAAGAAVACGAGLACPFDVA